MGATQEVTVGATQPSTNLTPAANAAKAATEAGKASVGATNRPAWLPAKFESAEAMAKSYSELESKLGGKSANAVTSESKGGVKTSATANEPNDAAKAANDGLAIQKAEAEAKGVDFTKLQGEFTANGKLSDDSVAALEKAGIPKAAIEAHIEGVKAKAELDSMKLMQGVEGGKEAFAKASQWAATNLKPAELDSYNEAVKSGNFGKAEAAVQNLMARYVNQNGNEKKIITGTTNKGEGDTFQSNEQFRQAMRDPRYKSDSAYREAQIAKFARSNL